MTEEERKELIGRRKEQIREAYKNHKDGHMTMVWMSSDRDGDLKAGVYIDPVFLGELEEMTDEKGFDRITRMIYDEAEYFSDRVITGLIRELDEEGKWGVESRIMEDEEDECAED